MIQYYCGHVWRESVWGLGLRVGYVWGTNTSRLEEELDGFLAA